MLNYNSNNIIKNGTSSLFVQLQKQKQRKRGREVSSRLTVTEGEVAYRKNRKQQQPHKTTEVTDIILCLESGPIRSQMKQIIIYKGEDIKSKIVLPEGKSRSPPCCTATDGTWQGLSCKFPSQCHNKLKSTDCSLLPIIN